MWFIVAIVVSVVLFSGDISNAAEQKTELIIEQTGPTWGDTSLFVAPNAVRIISHKFGFEEFSLAPDWKPQYYKARKQSPNAGFDYRLLFYEDIEKPNPFVEAGAGSWHGQQCRLYLEPQSAYTLCVDHLMPRSAEVICHYYHVPNFKRVPLINIFTKATPKEAAELLPEFQLPRCNGKTPAYDAQLYKQHTSTVSNKDIKTTAASDWLKIKTYGEKQPQSHFKFVTKSIRHVVLNKADFLPPAGAKPYKDPKSALLDSKSKGQLEDMIDSLGFSSASSRFDTRHSAPGGLIKKP